MVTSTPIRPTSSLRSDLPPDLLPSKYNPNIFLPGITPDVLTRGKHTVQQQTSAIRLHHHGPNNETRKSSLNSFKIQNTTSDKGNPTSDSDTEPNQDFAFIRNNAKRAFFTDSESSGGSKSPSPTNERTVVRRHRGSLDNGKINSTKLIDKEIITERIISQKHTFEAQDTKGPIRTDVVRRGLSLSNLLNISGGSMVTRTFSHVSLCSAESSATSSCGEARRPQRTISQVTLTFKKLSTADSSSSSSRDELEQASKSNTEENSKCSSRYRRSKSLPKSPPNVKRLENHQVHFLTLMRPTPRG